jgi:hypothetical protein
MITDTTICVARFNEDIKWLPSLQQSIVYNKGDDLDERLSAQLHSVVPMENLGRESSSYLTHIIRNYDNLSQITVFIQGKIHDHIRGPQDKFIRTIVAQAREHGYSKDRLIYNADHRHPHWGQEWNKNYLGSSDWFKQDNYNGNQRIAFVEWFEKMIETPYPESEIILYPNAMFAVDKDHILSRPKAFYQKLLDNVHWHNDPVEAHFLERSWFYIFNCHKPNDSLISKPQSVLILQTCDGTRYKPLLDLAEQAGQAYADKHGYSYRRYDGIKVGQMPWHATFNRIYLLEEELKNKTHDWVLYMDADTCFSGLEQSLLPFINKRNYAVLGCRGRSNNPAIFWDINAGVLFFNMNHPALPFIISSWKSKFESVPLQIRNEADQHIFEGNGGHLNDQTMLHDILHDFQFPVSYNYQGVHYNAFNYDGPLIRQILRTNGNKLEDRIAEMERNVRKVLETSQE